jgi:Asp-tRNA(Asn)/Glu-tRNA(Gln) amidotransferase A subunit family amidase
MVEDAAWLAAPDRESHNPFPKIVDCCAPPCLAAVKTPVWDQAEEHARRNFGENIQTLRKAGACVEEVELPGIFNLAHRVIRTIMAVEAALNLEELYLREPSVLSRP